MLTTSIPRRCATALLAACAATALTATAAHAEGQPMRCMQIHKEVSGSTKTLAGLFGIVLEPTGQPVGLNCVPAPAPNQHNFCATNNINGLIVLGRETTVLC
ncbi:hypothetical protein DZF91_11735 [Actinomadura logoneensis]|uniref:Uncharacterized protein n=1 Tax=Actinomadura logoneensis TaxID=2293572 RepID=A0A372JN99_9ACTN|nr:hydrophobin family protein [Actinomadura logoneensis]RFU41440.1 hypothetical protein DZF91_11735 [Actinomadura logoneensis]